MQQKKKKITNAFPYLFKWGTYDYLLYTSAKLWLNWKCILFPKELGFLKAPLEDGFVFQDINLYLI